MKIFYIVTFIVCSSVFGHVVADLLGISKPNPQKVENQTNACLQKEFQPLADLAVPVVQVIAAAALLLSGCDAPCGFNEDIQAKTQITLNNYVFYEANNCSEVVGEETAKAVQKPWNVLLSQTALVLSINSAVYKRLDGDAKHAVENSVTDIQSVAQCENPNFPDLLRSLLTLLYDRVGLVAATITTLNVVNILSGLPGCCTVPVIDLAVPLPLPI